MIEFILANVVDKNPKNENGDTPLHQAAKNGFLKICKLICQHAKDTHPENIKNNLGQTPIALACKNKLWKVINFLKARRSLFIVLNSCM